ncbi:uncharacterized protein si:ch211-250n8.1 isoform X4 [Syngnathoides biaculeatus]|uniref:uncharacterized protein si:ch211-250n8.1 isoform X4 n=1 Tax=Syngnathoides biaculeatus TaxID=300417 RepID=UPI002ADE29E1|nr:uncharacterized protein si:ch211-250n8.1 isoform X4 [Syngnathoides biaculeatus]
MAPRDPLLSALKVCLLNLQSDGGQTVTDSNPQLTSCCQLLELLLRKGLQQFLGCVCAFFAEPVLSLVTRDYWQCFEQLLHQDTCDRLCTVAWAVEQTKSCRKLLSAQGRGRYLLRLALSRKLLPQFVTHLLHTPGVLEWYSPAFSILRNEEFLEPFMSLLLVLSHMEFDLDMENCSFLDESWLLPVCEMYEVVPCRQVGMVLSYLGGRVFLLDFISGSQAHVDKFICRGDVIDEINGTSLRNSKNGQFGTKEVLQHAILHVLDENLPSKEVLLDLQETHLTCTESSSKETLCEYHYPEISCVGRYTKPDYTILGFCVVNRPPESTTSSQTRFSCVVLKAASTKECEEIVCRTATGFKHTEWSV